MKRFTKLAALVAGLATIFLSSCDNGMVDGTIEGMPKDTSREVTLSVTSDSELINFNTPVYGNQRSILPTAYTSNDVAFYLCYKDTTAATFTAAPMEVTFTGDTIAAGPGGTPAASTSTKKGTVVINLEQANYDLELFAVKKSVANAAGTYGTEALVKAAACLMATAQADLRYGNEVNFFLTSDGLIRTGDVELKLYADGWDPDDFVGYDVKADLYYTKSTTIGGQTYAAYTKVSSTNVTLVDASTTNTLKISSKIPKSTDTRAVNYSVSGVVAGTYLFELTFQKVGSTTKFYWNDDIKILPDTKTVAEVAITPTIDLPPSAPTSFNAGYIDNLKSEYYQLEFTWNGTTINNESNFKIDLLTVPSAVGDTDAINPTNDTEWSTLLSKAGGASAENVQYDTNFVGNPAVYKSGSLGKNSQVAIFKAAYGKRYVARICAVNEVGTSNWTYCDISTGITAGTPTGAIAATGFKSSEINRYKVTYNLSNGTLKDNANGDVANVYGCSQNFVTPTTSASQTKWWTISGGTKTYYTYAGGIPIMQPDGDTDFVYDLLGTSTTITKPTLKLNDTQKWTNWTVDGTNYNEIGSYVKPYGGFANLNLVANYATQASVTLFDDSDYAIANVSSTKGFEVAAGDGNNHYYVILAQDTDTTDKWTITPPTGIVYDYVTVTMYKTNSKNDYYTIPVEYKSATKTYEANLKVTTYRTGIYRAEICAYTSVREDPYTAQIGVTIVDTSLSGTAYILSGSAAITESSGTLTATPPTITKKVDGVVDNTYTSAWTYTWEMSDDGSTGWTAATGASNTATYSITETSTKYYRCIITDTTASKTSTSNIISDIYDLDGTPVVAAAGSTLSVSGITGVTRTLAGGSPTAVVSPTYTYTWEVSSDGTSWTTASGAGNAATHTATETGTNHFRCTVSANGASATSADVTVAN